MSEAPKFSLFSSGHWSAVSLKEHSFLAPLLPLFDSEVIEVFSLHEESFDRISAQGLVAALGTLEGQRIAILYQDFRLNGGSFTIENSKKANAFIEFVGEQKIPLVMAFNSIGVGIMEGRKVFMDSFATMPSLFDLRAKNIPIFSIAMGRCLGLSAILFQMGHYRIAVREKSSFNLTGPEVIRLFFGGDTNFDKEASGEVQFSQNDLVQELADDTESAFLKVKALLSLHFGNPKSGVYAFPTTKLEGEHFSSQNLHTAEDRIKEILMLVGESAFEVFEQMSPVVKTYLVKRGGKTLGVFLNPPGHPNNLIGLPALERYNAALSLFKSLGLPIISFLDTPGIDPRFEQQSNDIIRAIVSVGKRIIQYPHGHMGFSLGRCFGGATTLAFPKNFRSKHCWAVQGCQFGVMSESILEEVLQNSPRLLETRRKVRATEKEDFSDMIESGVIDGLIERAEISAKVHEFLQELAAPFIAPQAEHKPRARLHPPKPGESFDRRPRARLRAKSPTRFPHLPPKYSQ